MSPQMTITQVKSASLAQLQAENAELKKYLFAQKSVIEALERRVGRSLGALAKNLDHLTDSQQKSAGWHYHLDYMQQEINSLCDLIGDAMLLQKLEAGKVEVKVESLNLYPLLESVSRHLLNERDGNPARLVCKIAPRLPHVLADSELTEAVLTDLLARSMKYSDPASPVVLEVEVVSGQVVLRVTAQRFSPPGDRDFATEMILCCRQIEVQKGKVTCQHHPDGLQTVVITLPIASVSSC